MNWSQATFASKITIGRRKSPGHARSRRRPGDDCHQSACDRHDRPAPQRAALRDLAEHHEGQEKTLENIKPDALGVDVAPRLKTLKVVEPPKRKAGIRWADAAALVAKLRNEAKVIS